MVSDSNEILTSDNNNTSTEEHSENDDIPMPPLRDARKRRISTWDTKPVEGAEWQQEAEEWHDDTNDTRPLFIEMVELVKDIRGKYEWRESARWIKYEESVEKESERWSKPYVPSLNLPSIQALKSLLSQDVVFLNMMGESLKDIFTTVLNEGWSHDHFIQDKDELLETLCRRYVHLYERIRDSSMLENVLPTYGKNKQVERSRKISQAARTATVKQENENSTSKTPKCNTSFMKKIPTGAEACNILVGELKQLQEPISAFIRLSKPIILENVTEVAVPTRFILVILVPMGQLNEYCQVGRAMGAVMSDPCFKSAAYNAIDRKDLIAGLDGFLQGVTVLPPSGWDSNIRIEPVAATTKEHLESGSSDDDEKKDDGLARTGKFFGGLINDVKRKLPWYPSDFKDALSLQCLATWLFLYFACLTPMITFGGILGEATDRQMGTMEVMVAGCLCGVVFALFSGQPLLILGSTGPMLIFEKIIIQVSGSFDLNYMEFRVWIGIWVGVILLLLVAFDASAFVCYITRFTEENFATLVACIFIYEAIKNLLHVKDIDHDDRHDSNSSSTTAEPPSTPTTDRKDNNSIWSPEDTGTIFLMSIILFFGTFIISFLLKEFRSTRFFPTSIRYLISDFAVVIAIISMSCFDLGLGIDTPKLHVPTQFAPTIPSRGWLISPFQNNAIWTIGFAVVPALLATILIFMDQQITAVILNRADHKLKKGAGYHLDLLVLAVLIVTCSFLGLPWFIAATVESLTNLGSLKMESESSAPGEKPQFLGVREQRVTNLLVFITVGLSVLFTSLLSVVPMPVLYGVFLYMGFSALRKMELYERILLIFMPTKYQPDHMYLRHVPTAKVHLYTAIQVISLAVLWAIKSISATAIGFPLMLLVMMLLRKLLEFVFTLKELSALDDLLPGTKIDKGEKELV